MSVKTFINENLKKRIGKVIIETKKLTSTRASNLSLQTVGFRRNHDELKLSKYLKSFDLRYAATPGHKIEKHSIH